MVMSRKDNGFHIVMINLKPTEIFEEEKPWATRI